MIYVVGSGPAGVSAATALLALGLPVTILDAGLQLEPHRLQVVQQMRQVQPAGWDKQWVATVKQGTIASRRGVPLKYVYGSDFPYRESETFGSLVKEEVDTAGSLAEGGLSNVWGASVLPYRQDDLAGWPIGLADLEAHYRAVAAFVDLSARPDGLADLFPLYTDRAEALQPSRQAQALLDDLSRDEAELRGRGVHFGAARLAVRAGPRGHLPGCVYCGLCMYGCPYGLIYNSSETLHQLVARGLTYRSGIVVRRVRDTGGGVEIEAIDLRTGGILTLSGERVFLAGGPLGTTRILLESMGAYDHPLRLADSQYYLFPLLRYRKTGCPRREELNTMTQVFLEILDPAVSPHTVHLQVYTYNELYLAALKRMCGPLHPLLAWPMGAVAQRMLLVQGYLHSDDSPSIELTLSGPRGGVPGELRARSRPGPGDARAMVLRVVKKLKHCRHSLHAFPVRPMLSITRPGRGFHSGGTFPMTLRPGDFQSDIWGRPRGFQRVHAVDATVFPTVPATTITLSIMANAHRIASNYHSFQGAAQI